jgi:hypothetical protein
VHKNNCHGENAPPGSNIAIQHAVLINTLAHFEFHIQLHIQKPVAYIPEHKNTHKTVIAYFEYRSILLYIPDIQAEETIACRLS